MRKSLLSIFTAAALACMSSCSQIHDEVKPVPTATSAPRESAELEKIGTTKLGNVYSAVASKDELTAALAVLKAHSETSYDEFDLSTLHLVRTPKSPDSYVFTSLKDEARVLAIINLGQDSAQPIIVETKGTESVTYYNYVAGQAFQVQQIDDKIQVTTTDLGTGRRKPCGDAVAGCISDAYAGHGWLSVILTVASAFEPWITVGVAGACIAANC